MSDLIKIPYEGRMDSGPVQFGDDWPGIFLRGDRALPMSWYLSSLLDRVNDDERIDILTKIALRGLVQELGSCHMDNHREEQKQ